ncbi:hypothetical protein D3C81_1310530 [compost metagenome]
MDRRFDLLMPHDHGISVDNGLRRYERPVGSADAESLQRVPIPRGQSAADLGKMQPQRISLTLHPHEYRPAGYQLRFPVGEPTSAEGQPLAK